MKLSYSSILLLLLPLVYTLFLSGETLGIDTNSTICYQSPSNVSVSLEPVVNNLTSPVFIHFATIPGASEPSMFIGQRDGVIYHISDIDAPGYRSIFLNLTSEILPELNLTECDQRGLLAMAFHSDFTKNGKFYVWYTTSGDSSLPEETLDDLDIFEDEDGDYIDSNLTCNSNTTDHVNQLDEFEARLDNGTLIVTKVRTLLAEKHPYSNNNGIQNLEFNALDGLLYLGIGDGGWTNDPYKSAQDDDSIRGKILRINVDRLSSGDNCSTPISTISELLSSCPGVAAQTQVVTKGIRNLSGLSIISEKQIPTGTIVWEPESDMLQAVTQFGLMVTQIGQNEHHGIYLVRSLGSNLGWSYLDMTHCINLNESNACNISLPYNSDHASEDFGYEPSIQMTLPIAEYNNGTHAAIIGGRLYTGSDVDCLLTNKYIFASTNGYLYFIDPVQLLQVSFNTSDNSTGLPFPTTANLTDLCFANGTSPNEGSWFLEEYRENFLPIHQIEIANWDDLIGGYNSTSSIHITCVQVSPDGSSLYVCAQGPNGGSVLRMSIAGNVTVSDSFDLEYFEFD